MVNTFVTSKSLVECARNLDFKRLGKQRVEALQLINAIESGNSSWVRHPACRMWKDHVDPLKLYYNHMVREWIRRGFRNTMSLYDLNEDEFRIIETRFDGERTICLIPDDAIPSKTFPWWFSWEPFVNSHRASLVRKLPEHYKPLFECPELLPYMECGYVWPDTLPPTVQVHFDFSMITPVGLPAPVLTLFTVEEINQWAQRRNINPRSGRAISKQGQLYRSYELAFMWIKKFLKA